MIREIGANAEAAFDAIQRTDYAALAGAIRTSWQLNQRLDAGTNPPSVQAVLAPVADYLEACKLLGAGGGGYLLMLDRPAPDEMKDALSETIQVATETRISVEEIIRNHQAYWAYQQSIMPRYVARNQTDLRFSLGPSAVNLFLFFQK